MSYSFFICWYKKLHLSVIQPTLIGVWLHKRRGGVNSISCTRFCAPHRYLWHNSLLYFYIFLTRFVIFTFASDIGFLFDTERLLNYHYTFSYPFFFFAFPPSSPSCSLPSSFFFSFYFYTTYSFKLSQDMAFPVSSLQLRSFIVILLLCGQY